jgi:hypothetical protein
MSLQDNATGKTTSLDTWGRTSTNVQADMTIGSVNNMPAHRACSGEDPKFSLFCLLMMPYCSQPTEPAVHTRLNAGDAGREPLHIEYDPISAACSPRRRLVAGVALGF